MRWVWGGRTAGQEGGAADLVSKLNGIINKRDLVKSEFGT